MPQSIHDFWPLSARACMAAAIANAIRAMEACASSGATTAMKGIRAGFHESRAILATRGTRETCGMQEIRGIRGIRETSGMREIPGIRGICGIRETLEMQEITLCTTFATVRRVATTCAAAATGAIMSAVAMALTAVATALMAAAERALTAGLVAAAAAFAVADEE